MIVDPLYREELVESLTKDEQYDAFIAASLRRADGPVLRDVLAAELQHKGLTFDHAGRIVRAAIERLQEQGVAIVTEPKGGFYITDDPVKVRQEAERFRTLVAAHAKRARALDRIASRLERENINGGQRELFGEGR